MTYVFNATIHPLLLKLKSFHLQSVWQETSKMLKTRFLTDTTSLASWTTSTQDTVQRMARQLSRYGAQTFWTLIKTPGAASVQSQFKPSTSIQLIWNACLHSQTSFKRLFLSRYLWITNRTQEAIIPFGTTIGLRSPSWSQTEVQMKETQL